MSDTKLKMLKEVFKDFEVNNNIINTKRFLRCENKNNIKIWSSYVFSFLKKKMKDKWLLLTLEAIVIIILV